MSQAHGTPVNRSSEGGSPGRRGGGQNHGPSGVSTRPSDCPPGERRLNSPEKRSHRSFKLRDMRHRRLTSEAFCLPPHPVLGTLSPCDKFLSRRAGQCFLEKLHGHPPAPQKRRYPSSKNQEVSSQQNYIQRRQKAPPGFQRYFPTLL